MVAINMIGRVIRAVDPVRNCRIEESHHAAVRRDGLEMNKPAIL
jgi:hypothetical protein